LSNVHSFTILPSPKPVITSPKNKAPITESSTFNWTATASLSSFNNLIPGNFRVQVLFENNTQADLTDGKLGYETKVSGGILNEHSMKLEDLFTPDQVKDIMSRAGETLYWRVRVEPNYEEISQKRKTLWSELEDFTI